MQAFRLENSREFGFPSGHVSTVTVLWGGMALLFEKRVFRWMAPVAIVLVAISRMYLGRHFLADVIEGIVSGAVVLMIAYALIRWRIHDRLLDILRFAFMFAVPTSLALVATNAVGKGAGFLVGINAASLLVSSGGMPNDAGSLPKRAVRAALAILLYFAAYGVFEGILEITGSGSVEFVEDFVGGAFEVFACTFGTVALGRKLKLYESDVIETKDFERGSA